MRSGMAKKAVSVMSSFAAALLVCLASSGCTPRILDRTQENAPTMNNSARGVPAEPTQGLHPGETEAKRHGAPQTLSGAGSPGTSYPGTR